MTDFKVGDRIRLTGKEWGWTTEMPQPGTVVTVEAIDSDGDPVFTWDEEKYYIYYGYEAELVTDAPTYADVEDIARDYDAVIANITPHHVGQDFISASAIDPDHYKFPGGVEVRHISAHLTSFGGQAVQYVARATRLDGRNKGDEIENLKKAQKMIAWEIERLEAAE